MISRKHYEVILNHHALHTYGLMENYGVTRDRSCLLFDGVGRIDQGMHQSESHQTSRIIVFEPQCTAKANPYLYIDDYDVMRLVSEPSMKSIFITWKAVV